MTRFFIIFAIVEILCSCTRTVYQPVETVRTEAGYLIKHLTDTVIDRDTVLIAQRGDTVYSETVKWRLRIKETHDTVIIERTDSVSVPYPVEKELTQWQQAKIDFGGYAMLTLVTLVTLVSIVVLWLIKIRK